MTTQGKQMKETPQQTIQRKKSRNQSQGNQYQLKRDSDGTVWVSIQPLQKDIVEHIKILSDLDITDLDNFDQRDYDLKMLGLNSIYTFLGALITEIELKEKAQELKDE